MEYKDLTAEIRPRWEEILQRITTPAKKKGEYICLLCGHGAHGDGLRANPKSKSFGLKCFGSCQFSGDILAYLGEVEHLDSFPEQLERASSLLGISIEDYRPPKEAKAKVGQKQAKTERKETNTHMDIHTDTYTQTNTAKTSEPEESYLDYYKECTKRLSGNDYLTSRGISEETASKYWIGYEPEAEVWEDVGEGKKVKKIWKALIIPTSSSSYVIRNIDPKASKDNRYRKKGSVHFINSRALTKASSPIVITEGEIDALSIIDVGGEAIGLGSVDNINKFVEELRKSRPTQPLIIGLDNDEHGRDGAEKLSKALSELKLPFYEINLYGEAKDANEALQSDREGFSKTIGGLADRIRAQEKEATEKKRKEYLQTETAYSYLGEFMNGIKASANTPATPTGFSLFDDLIDGGLYEGLYCIGAITSLGKTTFALQVADQIASRTDRRILIFSLEMSRAELISKSLSRLTLIESFKKGKDKTYLAKTARGITDGDRHKNYSKEELQIMDNALKEYSSKYASKISIYEGIGDIGVNQIREEVDRVKRLFGEAPIVIVDYLQILAPYSEEYIRASDKQNTDKNVVELKRISRDYKTTIIGISSFNRDNYSAPVNLSSFKESGAIEYSSDVLIGLQFTGMDYQEGEADKAREKRIRELRRDQEAKGRNGQAQSIQLKVLKNRYGSKGDIVLGFYPMFNYFVEDLEASTEPIQRKKL